MRQIQKTVVNAFIFSSDDHILFGKSLRGSYEGMWLTPGGGVEGDETLKEALIREVQEETGLDISQEDIQQLDGVINGESKKVLKETGETVWAKYDFYNFVIKLSKLHAEIPAQSNDDFAEATWHKLADLKNLKMPPGSVQILTKLKLLW